VYKISVNFLDHYTAVVYTTQSRGRFWRWSDYVAWSHFGSWQLTSSQLLCPCSSTAHRYQEAEIQKVDPHDAGPSGPAEPSRTPEWHTVCSPPEARMPEVGYFCVMLHSAGHLQSQSFRL